MEVMTRPAVAVMAVELITAEAPVMELKQYQIIFALHLLIIPVSS